MAPPSSTTFIPLFGSPGGLVQLQSDWAACRAHHPNGMKKDGRGGSRSSLPGDARQAGEAVELTTSSPMAAERGGSMNGGADGPDEPAPLRSRRPVWPGWRSPSCYG